MTNKAYFRGKNNGTWQTWLTNIDSGNIASQSVKYACCASYNGSGTAFGTAATCAAGSFLSATGCAADSAKLGGTAASSYLKTNGCAADSAKLGGITATKHQKSLYNYSTVVAVKCNNFQDSTWYNYTAPSDGYFNISQHWGSSTSHGQQLLVSKSNSNNTACILGFTNYAGYGGGSCENDPPSGAVSVYVPKGCTVYYKAVGYSGALYYIYACFVR